jgi:hypothetical protein
MIYTLEPGLHAFQISLAHVADVAPSDLFHGIIHFLWQQITGSPIDTDLADCRTDHVPCPVSGDLWPNRPALSHATIMVIRIQIPALVEPSRRMRCVLNVLTFTVPSIPLHTLKQFLRRDLT